MATSQALRIMATPITVFLNIFLALLNNVGLGPLKSIKNPAQIKNTVAKTGVSIYRIKSIMFFTILKKSQVVQGVGLTELPHWTIGR